MIIKALLIYLPFVICGLTFWTFLASIRLGTRARAIGLMFLLLCAAKFLCFQAFGGDPFAPELPDWFIWVWNWLYSGLMVLFFLSVAALILRWIVRRIWKVECPRLVWLIALPVVAWGVAAWGCYNGTKRPALEEVTIIVDGLPSELDGYRILHISDIHVSAAARRWRTEAIVRMANEAGADLICLTGDYADGLSRHQFRNLEPLRELRAPDGVLAVTGNHEYYFDTLNWMLKYHQMENIRFLSNEWARPRPGLFVAGVPDQAGVTFGFAAPNPDAVLAQATNGEFRVLLQHRPSVDYERLLGRAMSEPVGLQLSGHTHGGISPGLRGLVAQWNDGLVLGLYPPPSGKPTYVTAGAGQWAGFPCRFFNDSVMTLITLRCSQD